MANISVNIRINDDLKRESDDLFRNLGLDFTSAVTEFLRQCVKEQRLPFPPPSRLTGREVTERALTDSQNNAGIHGPFKTFSAMMEDVYADP